MVWDHGVAGSNPVFPIFFIMGLDFIRNSSFFLNIGNFYIFLVQWSKKVKGMMKMGKYNLSDEIELYIKESLNNHNQVELRRQEIAEHFNCVPSQINYVIKTRFTVAKGYLVDSKRGGGGYIRITRMTQCSIEQVEQLLIEVPNELSYENVKKMVQYLYEVKLVSYRECEMFLGLISPDVLTCDNSKSVRANLTKRWLEFLRYEWKDEG